jgi:hypothetical protein
VPGADKTLNEQIRDVASMKSFSLVIFSEGRGTSRLEISVQQILLQELGILTTHKQVSYRQICSFLSSHYRRVRVNNKDTRFLSFLSQD